MDVSERQQFKDSVIGMYDRAAPIYGQVGTKQFTYFANVLVERLGVSAGAQALDIAAGRGALLLALAEKVGASGYVLGIDLAPAMVAETTAEIERRGLKQAEMRLMDGDAINFEANSFDVVTCGFALHFLDYEHTLPKILSMLKPGGVFAAIIPYTPVDDDLERWRWLFDLTKAVFPAGFVPPAAWIAPRKLNGPELARMAFEQAGFTRVQIDQQQATLYFKDEADWWDWEWSQGSRFWLEGMSAEGLERFKRESFAHLAAMKTANGIAMRDGALFAIGYKP
jgi:ubiquinone/menaquinone biosynthesis C-methylase UbiE